MKRVIFLTIFLAICSSSPPVLARQIFVDDSAAGVNDGSSWANAFNYLQDAIEAAQSGDEIRVAQGTYRPDQGDNVSTADREAAFKLIAGLTIKGGYAGFGAPDPDLRDCDGCKTILSGDLSGNDVEVNFANDLLTEPTRADNSYNILYAGTYVIAPPPVIDGITIKGASNRAVDMNHSDIIITDCIFEGNAAADSGGAYYSDNSRTLFTRCSFIGNAAGSSGGAVFSDGCGTCRSMFAGFVDCIFEGNYAGSTGGAVAGTSVTFTTAINCLFVGNKADFGAALYDDTYTYGNELGSYLVNCTFSGNNCTAILVGEYGRVNLTSCILWDNLCGPNGNIDAQIFCRTGNKTASSGVANVNYCCIQGWDGSLGGIGNFGDDPRFVSSGAWDLNLNYTAGDCRLQSDSPCIDAGDPAFIVAPTDPQIPSAYAFYNENMDPYIFRTSEEDLDGELRLLADRVDTGSYEYSEASSSVIYVDDSATGSNNGSNWANAFNHLQDALESAEPGDEIRIAQGEYRPDRGEQVVRGDREATFRCESNVIIRGGYAGAGAPNPDARDFDGYRTILTGDLAENDETLADPGLLLEHPSRSENSYHVVTISPDVCDVTLDGLAVTGGNASEGGYPGTTGSGAGIHKAYPSTAVLTDCTIIYNSANFEGGGMYNDGPLTMDRCRFIGNTAETGGGMENNTDWVDPAALTNCLFTGNFARSDGGAISSKCAAIECTNCTFSLNRAEGDGFYRGGGINGDDDTDMWLTNCIFWGNSDADGTVESSQIWQDYVSQTHVNYCCVQGWTGILGGEGNFGDDPLLIDPDGQDNSAGTIDDNARLGAGSPCINAGDPGYLPAPGETDLDGNPRLIGTAVDAGAYESQDGQPGSGLIYVDDSATGANNGSSWENAFNYLQDALDAAIPGNDILVAQGTYRPDRGDEVSIGDREAAFRITNPIVVKGGYAGVGQPDPDARDFKRFETILSGDLAENDAAIPDACDLLAHPTRTDNSSHVVIIDSEGIPLIEGFTITSGNSDAYGGGLLVDHSDAIITDCTFVNNSAAYDGGAMTFQNGRVVFRQCSFINNAAAADGGAVHLDGCSTCRSMYGAFIGCVFIGNYAGEDGGAVYSESYNLTTCIDSLFVGNKAGRYGGALVDSCYIGSYLTNCTFAGNYPRAVHVTLYGSANLRNCILWNNAIGTSIGQAAQISWVTNEYHPESVPVVNYSCIEGWDGSLGGVGNFGDNPRFVSPGSWDIDFNYTLGVYRLQEDSPCINTGDPNYPAEPTTVEIPSGYYWPDIYDPDDYIVKSTLTDLDALPRVVQGRVDMGAYEHYIAALIAHWKLDESEGATAEDSAGDNDGTLQGDSLWQPESGYLNGALLFYGDGDHVNCSNSETFDLTSQISVAAWVQIKSVNMDWQTVIAKGDSAWRLSTAEDEYRYHFAVTGGPPWNYINGDTVVVADEWHHVCGTYDGQYLQLYIDGAEDPVGPVAESGGITTNDFDVLIGENQEKPGRFWDGMIDDVRIYNYALSAMEVVQLFAPSVIYVDKDAPGLNNGTSWAHAFHCLQDALAIANEGVEIRVAQGTYTPDCGAGITPFDRDATFQLKNGVTIKGGYLGYGYPNPDVCNIGTCKTILSGDLLGNDAEVADPCRLPDEPTRVDNSRHIITADGLDRTAILDGVTVEGGYCNDRWTGGAAMYNNAASPTITNCTFEGNFAESGGAMINLNNSNPLLTNCTFTSNAAYSEEGGDGGAIVNGDSSPVFINCTFTRNWVSVQIPDHGGGYGGAIASRRSNLTITGCTFTENIALCGGGALENGYQCTAAINDCIFERNVALGGGDRWAHGGAIYNDYANPVVANCRFTANVGRDGGAVHNSHAEPVSANCIFSGNTARDMGGAVYYTYLSDATLTNCTFVGNNAANGNSIACYAFRPEHFNNLEIDNCIIWDGESPVWKSDESVIKVSYSNVRYGYPGLGNIDADPCFVTAGYRDNDGSWIEGDYHLKSAGWRWNAQREEWVFDRVTSRCIDAGNPGSPLGDEPLTIPEDPDNEYGVNLRINMGAYGGTAQASMPPHYWALLADINNDGAADFCDFACGAPYWCLTASQMPCDLDRDGDAGPSDLDLLSTDWLRTTTWWGHE